LARVEFDGECILGRGGPDEPLCYYARLQDIARRSLGRFRPTNIDDRIDWEDEWTCVGFTHEGRNYAWEDDRASDWFNPAVVDLINEALEDSNTPELFIELPVCDQVCH
jgi:hypothetical protein